MTMRWGGRYDDIDQSCSENSAWGHPMITRQEWRKLCSIELGKSYTWGAEGPDAYDCSGFARWAPAAALLQTVEPVHMVHTLVPQGYLSRRRNI